MQTLAFAVAAAFGVVFGAMAVQGVLNGRLKTEPSEPWITYKQHRSRFIAHTLLRAAICGFWTLVALSTATEGPY